MYSIAKKILESKENDNSSIFISIFSADEKSTRGEKLNIALFKSDIPKLYLSCDSYDADNGEMLDDNSCFYIEKSLNEEIYNAFVFLFQQIPLQKNKNEKTLYSDTNYYLDSNKIVDKKLYGDVFELSFIKDEKNPSNTVWLLHEFSNNKIGYNVVLQFFKELEMIAGEDYDAQLSSFQTLMNYSEDTKILKRTK